jgi:hypothetical protein
MSARGLLLLVQSVGLSALLGVVGKLESGSNRQGANLEAVSAALASDWYVKNS